ncbi:hypothetical protein ACFWXK_14180 [Streptomyces sp. NPDC059070]|uniref:hypothetical protein n=1 Tax=Streptomyces sp. NPDC059070 TaxID=3346713 RepID=UPI00369B5A50
MTDLARLAARIVALERRLEQLSATARLAHSSIEDGAITVYDDTGSLRGIIGQQPDGTTGAVPVNGPTPPAPSTPTVTPVLAALAVTWDGTWADVTAVGDLARIQVHLLASADAVPDPRTPAATIESQTGATVTVPCTSYAPVWVRLLAVTTSGTPGPASAAVQASPRRLVNTDVYEGTLTAKEIKANTLTLDQMDVNTVRAGLLTAGVIKADMLDVDALNGKSITGVHIVGGQIDGATLRTSAAGSSVEITSVPATGTELATGRIRMYSGAGTEVAPAQLWASYDPTTNLSRLRLQSAELRAPTPPRGARLASDPLYPGASMSMWSEPNIGHVEVSATEVELSASTTLAGDPLYSRLELASGANLTARTSDGQRAALYVHGRLMIDADGWISVFAQGWKAPDLASGWTHWGGIYDRVAYRIYPDRTVGLRGILRRTAKTAPTVGEALMVLPAECLPANGYVQQFTLTTLPGGALGTAPAQVSINLDPKTGSITFSNISTGASSQLATGNAYFTLNIRYPIG